MCVCGCAWVCVGVGGGVGKVENRTNIIDIRVLYTFALTTVVVDHNTNRPSIKHLLFTTTKQKFRNY